MATLKGFKDHPCQNDWTPLAVNRISKRLKIRLRVRGASQGDATGPFLGAAGMQRWCGP